VNAAEHADFIFVNANIHTVNERQRHAEAIAVKDQRIVFVGSNQDAAKFRGAKTRIIDLSGHTVVPA
jgi:Predicted metal-dependent hydrolase with the TIM-barrel fold